MKWLSASLSLLLVLAPMASRSAAPVEPAAEADPWAQLAADPSQAWALARTTVLPALTARQEAAEARRDAARSVLAGTAAPREALPGITWPLDTDATIAGALVAVDEDARARLRERRRALPALGSESRDRALAERLDATLTAEDEAGAAIRALLLAWQAALQDHPGLQRSAAAGARRELDEAVAEAEAAWGGPLDTGGAARLEAARRERSRHEALLAALRWRAAAPGAPLPDLQPDLEAARLPPRDATTWRASRRAADRLRLAAALEPAEQLQEAVLAQERAELTWLGARRAELEAALTEADASPSSPVEPPEVLGQRREAARAEAEQLRARVARLADDDPRRPALAAQLRNAELEARLAAAWGAVAADGADATTRAAADEAASAQRVAEQAEVVAEQARAQAVSPDDQALADLLEEVAAAKRDAQAAWEEATRVSAESMGPAEANRTRLETLVARVTAVAERSTFDPGRSDEASDLWREIHDLINRLAREALLAGEALQAATAEHRVAEDAVRGARQAVVEGERRVPEARRGEAQAALEGWRGAVDRLQEAADQVLTGVRTRHDRTLLDLFAAKQLRRRLAPLVRRSVRAEDEAFLFSDLELELDLLRPNLEATTRWRLDALLALPGQLVQFDRIEAFLVGSFWLLFGFVAWIALRSRLPLLTQPTLTWIANRDDSIYPTDLEGLRRPAEDLSKATVDLIFILLLVRPAREQLAELALALLLIQQIALYRWLLGLFQLAVSDRRHHRPSFVQLRSDAFARASSAARVLLGWVLVGRLARYVVHDVLVTDALTRLVKVGFTSGFFVLLIVVLHRSEALVRRGVRSSSVDGSLETWLTQQPAWPLRWLVSLVGVLAQLTSRSLDLLQSSVDERSALGRLFNLLARRRLANSAAEQQSLPLSQTARWELRRAITERSLDADQSALTEQGREAFASWQEEGNRGLLAVLGERGQGRGRFGRALGEELCGERPLRRLRLDRRLDSEAELVSWLCAGLELDTPPADASLDALGKALGQQERMVVLLEDLHWALLRKVGGLSVLRNLFGLITGASDRHFWIVTMHRPTWSYLERVGTVLNHSAFRAELELPRATAAELDALLGGCTVAAGYELDYRPLVGSRRGRIEPEEFERAETAFFRLLAEEADGNPLVAAERWLVCLAATPDEHLLQVRLPPSAPSLDLSDDELLGLAAVVLHEFLSVRELVEVNNIEERDARSVLQLLGSKGFLERSGDRWRVATDRIADVQRVLRRRHFVY